MDILGVLSFFSCLGVAMLIAEGVGIKNKIKLRPVLARCWHHLMIFSFAIVFVYIAGALTAALFIEYLFPKQSHYVFSGSPVTVVSYVFWGAIGLWVAAGGPNSDSDANGGLSTSVGRVEWLIGQAPKIGVWLLYGLAGIVIFAIVYLLGDHIEERLSAMSPAGAIILAGLIIAAAVIAVGRRR